MRRDMEESMKREILEQGRAIDQERLRQIEEEAAQMAAEELRRLQTERQTALVEKEEIAKSVMKQKESVEKEKEMAMKVKEEKDALLKKLKAMESKILRGEAKGGLLEVAQQKEEDLKSKEELLRKRRLEESEKMQRIAELEEANMDAEGKYNGLQDEAEQKTKKLRKLMKRFRAVNQEVDDMYAEFQREKEDLLDSIRLLQQQMQLKRAVIEGFIPPEEVNKVMRQARWDDSREVWVLEGRAASSKHGAAAGKLKRPMSVAGQRRPTSAFAKMANAIGDMNPRFKSENILSLDLDMPGRTTYDYECQGTDERVQALLDTAFADNPEPLMLGYGDNVNIFLANDSTSPFSVKPGSRHAYRNRPHSAAKLP
eukprot:evm.model.scf_2563.1 EVM.evm.TU.scf_2563.1   scf_2563:6943-10036(-)